MEVFDEWIPTEMIQLIVQDLSPEDYASLSMTSRNAQELLMGLPLLQVPEVITRQTVHLILSSNDDFFLTGEAGTGKSYTLSALHKEAKKRNLCVGMTATTGIAATNIPEGRTLHSFAAIPINLPRREVARRKKLGSSDLEGLDLLIIEEVSMLNPETLEILDLFLRTRNNPNKLMGGVKIVFVGDFMQLGPVKSTHVFKSLLWRRIDPKVIELTRAVRQRTDVRWFRDLSEIRRGKLSAETFERLCNIYKKVDEDELLDGRYGTVLFPTNSLCSDFNRKAFLRNKNPVSKQHTAVDQVYENRDGMLWPTNIMSLSDAQRIAKVQLVRVPDVVEFKHNALYVLTRNLDVKSGFINGLVCRYDAVKDKMWSLDQHEVLAGAENSEDEEDEVVKHPVPILYHKFTFCVKKDVYLVREQVSFRLAHALTIHSSQGMTLQKAAMDAGASVFAHGQTYTGMSRTKTRRSLLLLDLDPRSIRVNKEVIAYYDGLKHSSRYIRK